LAMRGMDKKETRLFLKRHTEEDGSFLRIRHISLRDGGGGREKRRRNSANSQCQRTGPVKSGRIFKEGMREKRTKKRDQKEMRGERGEVREGTV